MGTHKRGGKIQVILDKKLLVIDVPSLAARYVQNWEIHLKHSKPYQGRQGDFNDGSLTRLAFSLSDPDAL